MQQLRQIDAAGGVVMPNLWALRSVPPSPYRPLRLIDPRRTFRGLAQSSTQQETAIGSAAGGTLVSTLVATGAIAGPIGAAIGAGIGLVATLINTLFAPNYQKIQASNDANQIEVLMQQNLANWLGIPTNERYASVQAAALANFDKAWTQYLSLVQPDLANAPDSISDRQEGSCAYHTAVCAGWNGDTYVPNGPNQPTGCCWNWFVGYRDPIANDPNVQPDPSGSTASDSSATDYLLGSSGASTGTGISAAATSLSSSDLIWIGAALLAAGLLL